MLKIINKLNNAEVSYVVTNQSMTLDEAIEAAGGEIIDTGGADIADVRFDCDNYYYDDLDIVYESNDII